MQKMSVALERVHIYILEKRTKVGGDENKA